jgi:hypothetical protein
VKGLPWKNIYVIVDAEQQQKSGQQIADALTSAVMGQVMLYPMIT